jgi:hypothetical protein
MTLRPMASQHAESSDGTIGSEQHTISVRQCSAPAPPSGLGIGESVIK